MSDFNGIKKIDSLRNFYKGQSSYTNNETIGELREIKNELKVANDLTIIEEEKITNASGSPYLKDQPYYNKDVILGSIKETDWKEVKSYEDAKQEVIIFRNLRKLNII